MTAAAVPATPPAPAAPPPVAPVAPAPTPTIDPELFTADAPAFPSKVQEALAVAVDPSVVEVRSHDNLLYVPWIHYQRVLLNAFGRGGYRMVPRGPVRTEGNVVTWLKALFVCVPGETKFRFVKEAKGECRMQGGMTPGNAAEGAHSDALVKCCKELGIFMELFDPSWRRAWEAKYRPTHDKAVKAAQWPTSRTSNHAQPADDRSDGAGAASPENPSDKPTAPAAEPASPVSLPPGDTGEAATTEQKDALKAKIRELAWKRGYVRIWFDGLFGFGACADPLEALTQKQADTAYFLILAHGKPLYDKLLADERAKGNVR